MSIPLILVYALLRLPFTAKDLRVGHAGGHAKLIRVNVAVTIKKPPFKRCFGSERTISGQKQGDHLEVKMRENLLNREKQASFIVRVSSDDQVLPTRNDPLRRATHNPQFREKRGAVKSYIHTCSLVNRNQEFRITESADRATKPVLSRSPAEEKQG